MLRSTIIKFRLSGILALSLIIVGMTFSSCVKIKPTTVIVYIRNQDGTVSQNAQVRLYGQPSEFTSNNASKELRIDITASTDAEGRVYFDLTNFYEAGQTGMAILNVDAYKYNQVSSGFVQVVEQETNEATFFLH